MLFKIRQKDRLGVVRDIGMSVNAETKRSAVKWAATILPFKNKRALSAVPLARPVARTRFRNLGME